LIAAQAAFAQPARLQVIRHLRQNGPGTRSEIAEGVFIGHGLVAQSLNKLKSLGIVNDDATGAEVPARDRTYSLDCERTDHLLRTITSFIAGNDV
jgi:hypothetical protein